MTLFSFKSGVISGRLFIDSDGDNRQGDASGGFEAGIAGQAVALRDADGRVIRTATTDDTGNYVFSGLASGRYVVGFPARIGGSALVARDVGDDSADSDADPATGLTAVIHLPKGGACRHVDAGYRDITPRDGIVAGTDGDDLIDIAYAGDPEGDRIDNDDALLPGQSGDMDIVLAGAGDDTVLAGASDDVVVGGRGDDRLHGQAGNDSLFGGAGDDVLLGGDGDDLLVTGSAGGTLPEAGPISNDGPGNANFADAGAGEDTIIGSVGADTLLGGAGDDNISGAAGDDAIDGGAGADIILAGIGSDTVDDADGDNFIVTGPLGMADRGLPTPGIGRGVGGADADPLDDQDVVRTGAGNDTILTGDDADLIAAGDGDNRIDAGFDDDVIVTGAGNDSIIGGEGNDEIIAGAGDDTIFGGIDPALGVDLDLIDGAAPPADPLPFNGADTIDAGAGNDLVFGADDADMISGGDGDDTLDGGVDDDIISGGFGDDVIIGGQGADNMSGDVGNDTFRVGSFVDPVTGTVLREGPGDDVLGGEDADGRDVDRLDLTGGGALRIDYDPTDPTFDPATGIGESGTVTFFTDATRTTVLGRLSFAEIETVIPCFTPGTLIATPRGEVPVESLRQGDRVITRDNGIQEIRWIGRRTINRNELAANPGIKPILIKAGSLGQGLPERDMVVSPQHRLLLAGDRTQLYFDESEVFVAAKHLVNHGAIQTLETLRTTYIHFMCDRHEVVLSNGAWTESFQPGDQTLGAMGQEARNEILALFPDLAHMDGPADYPAARRALKAHEAKLLRL